MKQKSMKFMKILLPLVFVLASAPSFAVDAAITKTASPVVIIVTNGGTGLAPQRQFPFWDTFQDQNIAWN